MKGIPQPRLWAVRPSGFHNQEILSTEWRSLVIGFTVDADARPPLSSVASAVCAIAPYALFAGRDVFYVSLRCALAVSLGFRQRAGRRTCALHARTMCASGPSSARQPSACSRPPGFRNVKIQSAWISRGFADAAGYRVGSEVWNFRRSSRS